MLIHILKKALKIIWNKKKVLVALVVTQCLCSAKKTTKEHKMPGSLIALK